MKEQINWLDRMVPLTAVDLPDMMTLQSRMVQALPSARWYFTSDEATFADDLAHSIGYGIRVDGRLIAFAIACEGARQTADHSYAAITGDEQDHSLDFKDVMTDPDYRRMGLHSAFLQRFRQDAAALGCKRMYATTDPDNIPARSSFEKAGFEPLMTRMAYDGRPRIYHRLTL